MLYLVLGNSTNISILIPLIPLFSSIFIFVLLVSFSRTMNRLTKPVSGIIGLSLLGSSVLSSYFFLNKIEGDLVLSNYLKILEKPNLVIHFNLFSEKLIIFFSLIMVIVVGTSFYKLPRKRIRLIYGNNWDNFIFNNVRNIIG